MEMQHLLIMGMVDIQSNLIGEGEAVGARLLIIEASLPCSRGSNEASVDGMRCTATQLMRIG
jgi:hypothetical protein